MTYFIGIDGGGTKTDIILTDNKLKTVNSRTGPPSGFLSEGAETCVDVITGLIKEMLSQNNINAREIHTIACGIAGTGRVNDRRWLEERINKELYRDDIRFHKLIIETDGRTALEGAHSGSAGCVLVAGTGSVLFGKTDSGEIFRTGGFGRIIGDQGSAYAIGRKAFILLSESLDKRSPEGMLTNMTADAFNITSEDDLINSIYKTKIDIASAAPIVLQAAGSGDISAIEILDNESEELVKHISSASSKYDKEFKISFSGGLLDKENIYSEMLKEKIGRNYPQVILKQPDLSPAAGAVLLSDYKF